MEEFVDPGRSGKTVDKRPEFQRLLATIKARGDIDYVIVYALSRANRNRYDDAVMMMMLRQAGVTVISATENIDATPAGQLLHGILAAVNEFRVTSDGVDVRNKMEQKARMGGTPNRAPIGYLNVKEPSRAAKSLPSSLMNNADRSCCWRLNSTPPALTL